MKIILFILFNLFLLLSGEEKSKEVNLSDTIKNTGRDAVMAQDVQSFYTKNPASQKRNKAEFWEDRVFVPKLKR